MKKGRFKGSANELFFAFIFWDIQILDEVFHALRVLFHLVNKEDKIWNYSGLIAYAIA